MSSFSSVNSILPARQSSQNLPQGLYNQVGLRLGDNALGAQHGGVGHGAGDILLIHPLVVGNGGVETVHQLIRVLFKPSGPKVSWFVRSFLPVEIIIAKEGQTVVCPSESSFLQLALLAERLHRIGQTPQVDEAGGLGLIVVALVEGHQTLEYRVQGEDTEEVMMLPL